MSIRVTKAELRRRRKEIVRELGMPEEAFMAKVNSSEPLTDSEWSAMQELSGIDFLLDDERP
jgi:hypothetical protein